MSTAAQEEKKTETTAEGDKPKSSPASPASAPAAAAGAPAAKEGKESKETKEKEAPAASAERTPTRKLLSDSDDELPEDAEVFEMSAKSFKSRLARYSKKQLKEIFGTDDLDAIKKEREEHAQLKADKEEQRVAQLSEIEKAKDKAAKAEERAAAAEAKALEVETSRVLEKEGDRVSKILAEFFDPEYVEDQIRPVAAFIDSLSREEMKRPEKHIRKWAEDRIKRKPKLAKGADEADEKKPKVLMHNGPGAEGKPDGKAPPGSLLEKTAAPGKPNSMTPGELREFKRQNNLSF